MKDNIYCDAPWKNFSFFPDGSAFVCCHSDSALDKGCSSNFKDNTWVPLNIKSNSIHQIRNSDTFKKIRLEILNGKIPKACVPCKNHEKSMKTSLRLLRKTWVNFNYNDAIAMTEKDGTINNKIKTCELRFSTLCNLKCRICSPRASSRWDEEYKQLMTEFDFIPLHESGNNPEIMDQDFWVELIQYLDNDCTINMTGGEIMIIKNHWDFLEFLINKKNVNDIHLSYNINGTLIIDNAFDIWSQFKSVYLGLSIDDIGNRCEYLRYGLKWDRVLSNLNKIENNTKGVIDASFTPTLTWLSVYYFDEYLKFIRHYPTINFMFYFLFTPDILSPWILPEKIKHDIVKRCKPYLKKKYKIFKFSMLNRNTNVNLLQKGIKYNQWLDKRRNEDFTSTFPELYKKIRRYWHQTS